MNRWYARRRWLYWSLAALLVGDAVVYFSWIRRPVVLLENDGARMARLKREVAERDKEVARLRRVRDQAPQLRPQLEQFTRKRFLPEQTGFSRVARELEDAARVAGVRLGRVSYKTVLESEEPDFVRLVRVEIDTSVEGRYANLLRYLEELEHSPHFYLINELNVVGAESGQVQLEMRLATYFRQGLA